MNIYRLQYTETINRITYDRIIFLEAVDNAAAIIAANSKFPAGAINKKLYNIGTEVSLE